jgi:hypothetical protein
MQAIIKCISALAALAAVCALAGPADAQVPCRNVHTCQEAYVRCVDVRTRRNIPKTSLTCEASVAAWRRGASGAAPRSGPGPR